MDLFDLDLSENKNYDFSFLPDLYFDDMPLEQILNPEGKNPKNTPADLVTFWLNDNDLSPGCDLMLATLLAEEIEKIFMAEKIRKAKLLCLRIVDKPESDDLPEFVLVYFLLWAFCLTPDIKEGLRYYVKAQNLADLWYDKVNFNVRDQWYKMKIKASYFSEEHFQAKKKRIWYTDYSIINPFEKLEKESIDVTPETIRVKALEYIKGNRYAKAEKLYKLLLEIEYETAGTLCHLSRLYLMMDNIYEAIKLTEEAWQMRSKAKTYVVARILFLKLLFAFITDENSGFFLGMLKTILNSNISRMDWDMDFVLNTIKVYLDNSQYLFLMDLQKTMGTFGRIDELNRYDFWKNQVELPVPK